MQYRNHSLDHWHFLKTPVIFGNKYLKDPTFPVIYQTSCPAYWCRSCHLCFLVDLANKITAVVAVQSSGRQGWWCWLYGCLLTRSVKYYCPLDLKATASSWKHLSLLRNCSFDIFCHFLSRVFLPAFPMRQFTWACTVFCTRLSL